MTIRTPLTRFVAPAVLLCFLTGAARADFTSTTSAATNQFFIDVANKNVSLFTGHVQGVSPSNGLVTVVTVGAVNTGSGFGTIKPINGGSLTTLTFVPNNPNAFTAFSFRGQLVNAGSVTVTVQDNQGNP